MPVTQSDIDNLTLAINKSERQVSIGGQQVTYRSIADMIQAVDFLTRQLQTQEGVVNPTRATKLYHAGRGVD